MHWQAELCRAGWNHMSQSRKSHLAPWYSQAFFLKFSNKIKHKSDDMIIYLLAVLGWTRWENGAAHISMSQMFSCLRSSHSVNPLSPNIKMHILLTVFSFFMLPVGRISLNIKTFHLW